MNYFYREKISTTKIGEITIQHYPAHFHRTAEIIFVVEGTATAICDGKSYFLKPGCILFIAPELVHKFINSSNPYYGMIIQVDPNLFLGDISLTDKIPKSPLFEDPQQKNIGWDLMRAAIKRRYEIDQDMLILLSSAIMRALLKDFPMQERDKSGKSVMRILDYCQEHFREPVTVSQMAKDLYLSQSHISHTFSKVLDISFPEYINILRVNEAIRLLNSTDYSITEIAGLSGYSTTRNFYGAFVKHIGVAPSVYRNMK